MLLNLETLGNRDYIHSTTIVDHCIDHCSEYFTLAIREPLRSPHILSSAKEGNKGFCIFDGRKYYIQPIDGTISKKKEELTERQKDLLFLSDVCKYTINKPKLFSVYLTVRPFKQLDKVSAVCTEITNSKYRVVITNNGIEIFNNILIVDEK